MNHTEQIADTVLRTHASAFHVCANETQRARVVSEAARAIAPTPQPAHELAGYWLITVEPTDGRARETCFTRQAPAEFIADEPVVLLFAMPISQAEYERWGGAKEK